MLTEHFSFSGFLKIAYFSSPFSYSLHYLLTPKTKEMAAHSSILAWKIPWTMEPGRLPSMGSQRVGHNWADSHPKTKKVFPGGASGKEPVCQCRRHKDAGLIPGSGRSPGGGHGNPLQYSCQDNPMDRGAWRATVHGVAKSQTRLSTHAHTLDQGSNPGLLHCRRFFTIWATRDALIGV